MKPATPAIRILTIPAGIAMLVLAACAGDTANSASPESTASPTREPAPETTPTPTPAEKPVTPSAEPTTGATGPTEPGETAWFELVLQGTGQLTGGDDDSDGEFHEGHVFGAGTLDAGQTVRLELPEPHAFADDPRAGQVLVGSDDGSASEVVLVDAASGDHETLITDEAIVWGGSLSPDASDVYYVPVDRDSMTDTGLWRMAAEPGAAPEQLIQQITPATYDFASQHRFAWSPDGEYLVVQYCNRAECLAHVVEVGSGESRLHDAAGIFELRGSTDDEYIADAIADEERSGILAVDLQTLEVRVVTDEWGVSEVHETDDGPLLVYFAPDQPVREMALIGLWLDRDQDAFVVYEDRATDTPPQHDFSPGGSGYEAPEGSMLMWPGSPGPDPDPREPQFLLLDILSGEGMTFPYEREPPR